MVKKLVLNCNFPSGKATPVNFFVGNPANDSHPIEFQSQWLSNQYGGKVPSEIMDSMEELHRISIKNKLKFEDLCEYVFTEVNALNSTNKEKQMRQKQVAYIKSNDPITNQQKTENDGQ